MRVFGEKNSIPSWVVWVAQDEDGSWWGFEHIPNECDQGWYENEVGRYVRLSKAEANPQWRDSLRKLGQAHV